jgi:hypothetical protein
MKTKIEKMHCEKCPDSKLYSLKKIYKLTWRYNDKERTYRNSKIKIIHTGALYLCKKHLEEQI